MASISSPSLILVRLIASMVRGDKIPVDGVQLKTIQQQNARVSTWVGLRIMLAQISFPL